MKINIIHYLQQEEHACGPSCLRMVFEHLGEKYSEEKLIVLCQTSERYGTSHKNFIKAIRNEKFEHYAKSNGQLDDLINCVEAGYLAIINYLEPFSNGGHYAVVTGYTDDKKAIILADPHHGNDFIVSWKELKERWHNHNNTSHGWFVVIGKELIEM